MNFNNPYFNPYQQYPYTQQYQPQQVQQPQTSYLPLTFVSGLEGAKAFIVGANQVVYLRDSDSNILYEKKADAQGRYTLTAYELNAIDTNAQTQQPKSEYATTTDLNALKSFFIEQMNILSSDLKKCVKSQPSEE